MNKRLIIINFLLLIVISLFADPPAVFDLRDYNGENFVTSVKSQQGGTCWTHGTMASIESNLIMTNEWEENNETGEPNLAEYHLDWWNGYNQHYNEDLDPPVGDGLTVHQGGDYYVSTAYLSRGEGAVRDIDGQSYNTPPTHISDDYHYYYPRDVEWYTMDSELNGINLIKEQIMNHGAIATCMCYDDQFINYEYEHYQPETSDLLPNHSVTIVGWNDNRETQAPEAGAWLVKNSWGSSWGDNGYFWISYYDKHAAKNFEMGTVLFKNVEAMQYENVYYHDYHGARDVKGDYSEAFNAFQAENDELIKAVSFFTATDNVQFNVKIYDDFSDGQLSNLLSEVSGDIDYRGFHTVDLIDQVEISNEDDFYLYVKFSEGGHTFDRTSDVPVLLGASYRTIVTSTANPEESFYKDPSGNWLDFYDDESIEYPQTGNFCLKALTVNNFSSGTPPSNLHGSVIYDNDVNLTWEMDSKARDFLGFKVYRDDEMISEISGFITQFTDENLDQGTYSYEVKAVYDNGDSDASNSLEIEITLPVPQNLSAVISDDNSVVLQWDEPEMQSNVEEYLIYRNNEIIHNTNHDYYIDQNLESGEYEYHITAVFDGYESSPSNSESVQITSSEDNAISATKLNECYPNPFNPETTISFNLENKSRVKIEIFNILGQKVKTLVDSEMDSGSHSVKWYGKDNNNKNLSSGVYFYKMKNGRYTSTKKMILMK